VFDYPKKKKVTLLTASTHTFERRKRDKREGKRAQTVLLLVSVQRVREREIG